MNKALMCLFALIALCTLVSAKVSSGTVKGSKFLYLEKFCYDTHGNGSLAFTINANANLTFLFVDDMDGNWTDIYKNKGSMDCATILEKATYSQEIDSAGVVYTGEDLFEDFEREHFWYFAVIDCNNNGEVEVDYHMTMTQGRASKWYHQFSFDEQGLEGLYVFYFVVYVLFGLVHAYAVYNLMRTKAYHAIVKLFTIALVLQAISVMFLLIHYAVYSNNGIGATGLKGLGELLDIGTQLSFILLLILVSKGWCITKTQIEDRLIVLGGLGVLSVLYLVMFIVYNVMSHNPTTLYIYQTVPGILILVMRGLTMLWFAWCVRRTFNDEQDQYKREFYIWFGIAYIIWLLTLPIITSIAAGIDPWFRQKTVLGMYVTMNFLGLGGLQFLLWPSRATQYFQISSRLDLAGTIPYETF